MSSSLPSVGLLLCAFYQAYLQHPDLTTLLGCPWTACVWFRCSAGSSQEQALGFQITGSSSSWGKFRSAQVCQSTSTGNIILCAVHNTGFAFNLSGVSVCNKNTWDVAGVLVLQSLITVWGGGGKELLQLHYIRYKTFFF